MAYVIAEPCIDHQDQSCVAACPVDCITFEPGVDRKLYIDPDGCIDCGSCATSCPNDAIFRPQDLPGPWRAYAAIDRTWYRDPDAARQGVEDLLRMAV